MTPYPPLTRTVVYGTEDNPDGIANKTAKETTIYDEYNNIAMTETYVFTGGSNYDRISWTVKEYDFRGKVTKTYHSDGTEVDTTWALCGCAKASETDGAGVEWTYSQDLLGRIMSETKKGSNSPDDDFVTSYVYDAADRRLSTTISSDGLSLMTSSNEYNLAGQMTSSVGALGIETTYTETEGGRIRTTIRAGVTNVTENYLDGKTKYTSQNGVIQQYYDYGVSANGEQWTKVYTGPDGTNSASWSKNTTDMLGRTVKTESPAFGGGVNTMTYAYNTKGQMISQSRISGGVTNTTLYEYDALGAVIRRGLDINADGDIDLAGPDRVSGSDRYYGQDAGNDWWNVSVSTIYAEESGSAVTTNSIQKTRLTGLSADKTSESVSEDILGNQVVGTTACYQPN